MSQQKVKTITRREAIKRGLAGTAGLAGYSLLDGGTRADAQTQRRPNVIIIHTDDQNYEHIGCYGSNVYTPHQDSLAEDGVRFTRSYSTIAICTPSRYSCLTGQYPSRCPHPDFLQAFPDGVQLEPSFNTPLKPDAPNLARVMKDAGYTTGMVGKWHLGESTRKNMEDRGLMPFPSTNAWIRVETEANPRDPKISKILRNNHDRYREEIKACGFDYAESIYWNNPEAWRSHPFNIHNMEWVVKGALDFIDQNRDKPFFLYMAPTLHHIPHPQESLMQADPRITIAGYLDEAPDVMPPRNEIINRVKAAGCATETAFCTWLDDGIGAILTRLRQLKLDEDTIIIFFSDHQTHAKGTLYEGGVKSPCMIRWTRRIPRGQECHNLAQNIDFAPSIFDACNVTKPSNMQIDGKSLIPMLLGQQKAVHDELFFEIGWTRAVCTERWKYLALRYSEAAKKLGRQLYHNRALEPHQHNVLLEHPNFWDPDQLYDLSTDSIETINLAYDTANADILDNMKGRLKRFLATFGNHPFGEFI